MTARKSNLLERPPEHEFEAAHGLPEALPETERLLWQGAPDWRLLARDAMHLRGMAVYFALLLTWRGADVLGNGGSADDASIAVAPLLGLAVVALVLLAALAWLIARTSVYTLTDRRVVMRVGIVLTITFNLPYSQVEGAALRSRADGSGDLTLLLAPSDHIAYLHLWPHVRPWQVKRPQPMLRALADARGASAVLATALAASASSTRPAPQPVRLPARAVAPSAVAQAQPSPHVMAA